MKASLNVESSGKRGVYGIYFQPTAETPQYVTAPMKAAAGIGSIQAQTIWRATPQRTAERRRVAPTPTIAPVIVCVVETGMPKELAMKSVIAPAVSAAKPPTGCSFVIFEPIVWMIRQPPDSVPRPIAVCAERITHIGIVNVFKYPAVKSTPAMIPIVFCASFVPWPRE